MYGLDNSCDSCRDQIARLGMNIARPPPKEQKRIVPHRVEVSAPELQQGLVPISIKEDSMLHVRVCVMAIQTFASCV
jgi:hypothetical protein